MHEERSRIAFEIANLCISCVSNHDSIRFNTNFLQHYLVSFQKQVDYCFIFNRFEDDVLKNYKLVFEGKPQLNEYYNYSWQIFRLNDEIAIKVDFFDDNLIKRIVAKLKETSKTIQLFVETKSYNEEVILIDPLIHPLGSILLMYIQQWNNALLIHSSGVKIHDDVYVFTGVSGIGKTTMSGLWKEKGAEVLNDDRLILKIQDREVVAYNNPMPYYSQYPQMGRLKAICILKQSPINSVKQLSGVKAYSMVMGNFIQQFYDKSIVERQLSLIEKLVANTNVFEVAFKPDTEIVDVILNHKL